MMLSVAPIWDGNETWLILGGGGLFAVFHLAYAILLPALYIPLILMLIALIFRGVAFEFRFKADRSKPSGITRSTTAPSSRPSRRAWCSAPSCRAFQIDGRQFTGGTFDWLTPFSVMTGIGLVMRLRPSRRHLVRDEDDGRARDLGAPEGDARSCSPPSSPWRIVSLWVPFLGREIETRWFSWPNIAFLAPVPLITAFTAYRISAISSAGRDLRPFFLAIGLFLLGFLGLGVSLFPYIVPPSLTIWQTANTVSSQLFALVGFAIVMPLTFVYTAYAYYVFRGKVAEESQAAATDITDAGRHASSSAGASLETAPLVRVHICREPRGLRRRRLWPAGDHSALSVTDRCR